MTEPFKTIRAKKCHPFGCSTELVFTRRLPRPEEVADRNDAERLRELLAWLENEVLPEAVREGDTERVRALLAAGVQPTFSDEFQGNILTIAAANGYTEIVSMLLQAGVDINGRDEDGTTPLCHAIKHVAYDNGRMYELLMSAGADIHGDGTLGRTPLEAAIFFCEGHIVATLLELGVNPNAPGSEGAPLEFALREENDGIAELLIKAGALPVAQEPE